MSPDLRDRRPTGQGRPERSRPGSRPPAGVHDDPGPLAAMAMEPRHFALLARLAREDAGLSLPPAKRDLVHARLVTRVRALGLPDFGAYCDRLVGPGGAEERGLMLQALTTNVTRFFREEHHFALLRESVLPPLLARARAGGRVRLWSAGCSSGEEAYSLAFTVLDLCPDAPRLDLRILATDVDPAVLAAAEAGLYDRDSARALPASARRHVEAHPGPRPELPTRGLPEMRPQTRPETRPPSQGDGISVRAAARALVSFRRLNLVGEWPFGGGFDAVLCRNVAIYFDRGTQSRLWARLAERLPPGGHLMIGHSERLSGPAESLFDSVGLTAYRRRDP